MKEIYSDGGGGVGGGGGGNSRELDADDEGMMLSCIDVM